MEVRRSNLRGDTHAANLLSPFHAPALNCVHLSKEAVAGEVSVPVVYSNRVSQALAGRSDPRHYSVGRCIYRGALGHYEVKAVVLDFNLVDRVVTEAGGGSGLNIGNAFQRHRERGYHLPFFA